jgi:hypothetical protein
MVADQSGAMIMPSRTPPGVIRSDDERYSCAITQTLVHHRKA